MRTTPHDVYFRVMGFWSNRSVIIFPLRVGLGGTHPVVGLQRAGCCSREPGSIAQSSSPGWLDSDNDKIGFDGKTCCCRSMTTMSSLLLPGTPNEK